MHAQTAHMLTHMHINVHAPTPQLRRLPINAPASAVYMALPIEQMLWNLRCKSTPLHTPSNTHMRACGFTHTNTNPSLSPYHLPTPLISHPLPPAGPAMSMPCGAPFPLALRLWLCQLCRVWPPPTGKTKKAGRLKVDSFFVRLQVHVCFPKRRDGAKL